MIYIDYPESATPLSPEETEGLLLTHITSRPELDRWEQENINEALIWIERHRPKEFFTETFIKKLHKRMFGNVWKWAGCFRKTEKNLGVPFYQIPVELKKLFDDSLFWIDNKTFNEDETAARFHHRLVYIHPFANGNGRHARVMADIILKYLFCRPRFTWGSANLTKDGMDRKRYIEALIAADRGDYNPLIKFVRS